MKKIISFIIIQMFFVFCVQAQSSNIVIKKIDTNAPNGIKPLFSSYFTNYLNRAVDPISFKLKIDQVNKELFAMGYYDSKFNATVNGDTIFLDFNVGVMTSFQFRGSTYFSFSEMKQKITNKIKADIGKIDEESLKSLIVEMYEEVGVYGTTVKINFLIGRDRFGLKTQAIILNINEGEKMPLLKIAYRGNSFLSEEYLNNLFYSGGTPLIRQNYYDKAYVENFSNIIKKEYLTNGFVSAEISKARVTSIEDEPVELEYSINEKNQFKIKEIKLESLSLDLSNEIKAKLKNKEGMPINIPELENDFKKIVFTLQDKGHYFATIANLNSSKLLQYDYLNNLVDLNIDINLENKICFNDVSINGNTKTKNEVILREINLEKGEIISPEKIEFIRQKLSGLGLFSNIKITPYIIYGENNSNDCSKSNLVIQLKEKDFGLVEFSPGFRTDLGAKAGVGLTMNNLQGMNRAFSFKIQGNQRFNLDTLDDRRRIEDKKLLEYSGKISFSDPYFMYQQIKTQIEAETSISWQRKRFSNFDADILRISPQLSKNFNKFLASTIKYQLEKINQFDATEVKDNDNFRIGSITPSMTLDFRDDPINPKKGSYFNLTSEWANRYFGSMKESNFEVNYLKLTLRNKFYFSVDNLIFATSVSTGYEKNYANDFYIPSIKVFRLDGFDEIRGFEDSEINRLPSGSEVSKVIVTNSAYFVAFKFEPRYNLTDNFQLNVFFDAGRVFLNYFQPFNLRTSIGAGFKILTPVGSLDFDYGVKLKRANYSDGSRDAFGRFHLSIGFF